MLTATCSLVEGKPVPAICLDVTGMLQTSLWVPALHRRQWVKGSAAWVGQIGGRAAAVAQQLPQPIALLQRNYLLLKKKRALAIYLPLAASQTGTARLHAFVIMRTTFVWYTGLVGDWRDGMEDRKFNPLHFHVKDNWSPFFRMKKGNFLYGKI